jgi:hypothetical protein
MPKKNAHKIAITVIASIILTILLVSLVNVGLAIFLEGPEYDDFCGQSDYRPILAEGKEEPVVCTADVKECPDGTSVSRDPARNCEFKPCKSDFKTCQEEYESARDDYNQIRYYVFAIIGFALLLFGLFSKEHMFQYTGLATGGILLTEGIVTNLENKTIVFISLLVILIIFGVIAYKVTRK